jgi:hypothetical protein
VRHATTSKDILSELALYSLIFTTSVIVWLAMSGESPTLPLAIKTLVFMVGAICWSMASQSIWISNNTLNTYLPIGFSICSGVSLLLIEAHLGTTFSSILASLIGVITLVKLKFRETNQNRSKIHESRNQHIKQGVLRLILGISLATFLMQDQLHSVISLSVSSVSTTIQGWSDLILHANTALSLANLPLGASPISTIDAFRPSHPYHFGSYILPALITSEFNAPSPLISFISITTPLGLALVSLPLMDRLARGRKGRALSGALVTTSSAVFIYAIWVKVAPTSFFDPVWLLITAPATLYACSVVLSALEIGINNGKIIEGRVAQTSLILLTLVLTLIHKLQVFHVILIAGICLSSHNLLFSARQHCPRWLTIGSVAISICALQLIVYSRLGIDRSDYILSFQDFLTTIRSSFLPSINQSTLPTDTAARLADLLLGGILLCGPVFIAGWILTNSNQRCLMVPRALVPFILISFFLAVLISPAMPWDQSEFQNRSWPLLWCIGVWLLAGYRMKNEGDYHIANLSLSFAMLLGSWLILPANKRLSAAQPPLAEWTKDYYPYTIKSSEKKLAASLASISTNDLFFIPDTDQTEILQDTASTIAALSGRRPLFSRLGFQIAMQFGASKEIKRKNIYNYYKYLAERRRQGCASSKASKVLSKNLPNFIPIKIKDQIKIWIQCDPTEYKQNKL